MSQQLVPADFLGPWAPAINARLERWLEEGAVGRLWAKDRTLWSAEPAPEIEDRLGWLTLPEAMQAELPSLEAFATEVAAAGITHALLLGMGGSSLAPEVFDRTFGRAPGHCRNSSSSTARIRRPVRRRTSRRSIWQRRWSLFPASPAGRSSPTVFSTTSGTGWRPSSAAPGRRFVAVTDPGTVLDKLAKEKGFRRIFTAPVRSAAAFPRSPPSAWCRRPWSGSLWPPCSAQRPRWPTACGPEVPAPGQSRARARGCALGQAALAGESTS